MKTFEIEFNGINETFNAVVKTVDLEGNELITKKPFKSKEDCLSFFKDILNQVTALKTKLENDLEQVNLDITNINKLFN